jgi:RHS repeat-associated protein
VQQTRNGSTQTRTWTYTGALLTQTSFPETGTTTYAYNANNTLLHKIDAKNQKTKYTYDSLGRTTTVEFYSVSTNPSPDAYSTVSIQYDSTTPPGWTPTNETGRVARLSYYAGTREIREYFNYNSAGQVTTKRFRIMPSSTYWLDANWTYDTEGRMTSIAYPNAGPTYNFTFDSMGRAAGMTQSGGGTLVNNITYGPAGELLTMSYLGYNETRQYNNVLQMTRLTTNNAVGVQTDFEYRFPTAGSNNGQLWQMKDWVTGEEVTYAYDALQRLSSATTTGPEWGQSYTYDGFGNLLSQTVTKGTAPYMSINVDPLTNRVVGTSYDSNGNDLTHGAYDVSNRLKQTTGGVQYGYAPDNKRVWKKVDSNPANDEFYFWSGNQRLGTYKSSNPGNAAFTTASTNVYFGGRLIQAAGTAVLIDRLGSNVTGGKRYFPYGQEKPSATANNIEKFTGYFRDAESGLDYADQRYHNPGMGRFTTPDPAGSGLNWYAYVGGDPINTVDPLGMEGAPSDTVSCGDYRMAVRRDVCAGAKAIASLFSSAGSAAHDSVTAYALANVCDSARDCARICIEEAFLESECRKLVVILIPIQHIPRPRGPGSRYNPACKDYFEESHCLFVYQHRLSAGLLSDHTGNMLSGSLILAWAAMESGWGTNSWSQRDNNYFSYALGRQYRSFYQNGTTALFDTNNYLRYNGETGVSSFTILSDQLARGAGIIQAFNTLATSGYAPDPAESARYGLAVFNRLIEVRLIELFLARQLSF